MMTWLQALDFLRAQRASVDEERDVATVLVQTVMIRVSWSEKSQALGFIADVATARGLTEREIEAAGKGFRHGKLVVVSERIMLCHAAPIGLMGVKGLAEVLAAFAGQVTTLRMRWATLSVAA